MAEYKNFFTPEETGSFEIEWGATLWPLTDAEQTGSEALMKTGIMSFHQYGGHGKHVHGQERQKVEMMYCLSGEGIHIFWDKKGVPRKYNIRPGDFIYCDRDMPHGTTNDNPEPFVCLILNGR